MNTFPEWVPEEVIEYYRRKCEPKEYTDEHTQIVTDTLRRVMESEKMRKAWEAIARRGDEIRPWFFSSIIEDAVRASEQMEAFPPPEQIETFRQLTSKLQVLSQKFDDALGHWADGVMLHYFKNRPDKALRELADNMEVFTQMVEEHRKFLTDRTGKPGSKSAKRTFMIRLISESVTEWWGTPLHVTVAATVGVILDETISSEDVRKIVAYQMTK